MRVEGLTGVGSVRRNIGELMKEDIKKPEVRKFGKVISTKKARLELIPKSALEALALIFETGIDRKGDGAWNALTQAHAEVITSKEFVIERLSHVVHHCYDAIAKLVKDEVWEGEEDSGAILFGGAVLAEYKRILKEKNE